MFCNITTSTDQKEIAKKISRKLLEKKYSPCVQITSPVESQYLWDGEIKSTQEYKIDIKTLDDLSEKVMIIIKSIHNYKVPEIIKKPIAIENKDYKSWVLENTKK